MLVFPYQAAGDRFSPIESTDWLVQRYCEVGARIRFERNTVGGHLAEIVNGPPRAQAWLQGGVGGDGGVGAGGV